MYLSRMLFQKKSFLILTVRRTFMHREKIRSSDIWELCLVI